MSYSAPASMAAGEVFCGVVRNYVLRDSVIASISRLRDCGELISRRLTRRSEAKENLRLVMAMMKGAVGLLTVRARSTNQF